MLQSMFTAQYFDPAFSCGQLVVKIPPLLFLLHDSLVPRPFCYAHAREGKEGSGK